jgi:hypothetical protein
VRFADTTLIDLAADGTPADLEFAYTLSAQSKLVLTAHEVYLPKPKLAVEGPGGVQASFDFRGAKNTAAGRMLTVTLTNDLDRSGLRGVPAGPLRTQRTRPGLPLHRLQHEAPPASGVHLLPQGDRGGGPAGASIFQVVLDTYATHKYSPNRK